MDETLLQLTVSMGMGVVRFDADLQVLDSRRLPGTLGFGNGGVRPGAALCTLFPEFVGSEENLREVLTGRQADLNLPNINREDDDGSLQYWDLLVLRDAQTGDGLLLIRDVTSRGRMVRELNQRRYDSLLYRGVMKSADSSADQRLLGTSPAMEKLRSDIEKIGRVPSATVLLQGETGTGKSHVARVIHYHSCPAGAPFVEINCASLPENLIESELFGYEKGAFTQADRLRKGLLEEGEGGTVFLDEIAELPVNLQAKLLTAIETKEIRRLGGSRPLRFRARIIAATNRDLQEEIRNRRFRQDLFFRLNVAPLTIPALRHLDRDVLQIAEHFIRILNAEFGKRVEGLSAASQNALMDHPWPGNIRELRNCIERAMIFVDEGPIDVADLMLMPPAADADAAPSWSLPAGGLSLESVERHLIQSAMDRAGGNKTRAAALLGLTRDTLRYRLEKFSMG